MLYNGLYDKIILFEGVRFDMEIITIECPKCKGELHVKEGTEKFFCMYCRGEVVIKQPEQTEVVVESVNHEFQAKLAIAKHNEELYRKKEVTFNQVMKSYDEVRLIGAHHWEYWHARANFFVKSGLRRIKRSNRKAEKEDKSRYEVLASRKAFIDTYTMWMDSAIKHGKGNVDELEKEREKTLRKIEQVLENTEEHNPESREPFMPRPQTPDEAVSGCLLWIAVAVIAGIIMAAAG